MSIATRCRRTAASGYTLLEMMVALTIFSVVGYALTVAIDVASHSQKTVMRVTAEDRGLREATAFLIDELRTSSDATITIAVLADGNHRIRFQMPIDVAGAAVWGVHDRKLSPVLAQQTRQGWFVQYTVRALPAVNGVINRQLVRQILDAAFTVKRETVILDGLRRGTDVPPGFKMVKVGDLWELTLSTVGEINGKVGMRTVFHVQTRN